VAPRRLRRPPRSRPGAERRAEPPPLDTERARSRTQANDRPTDAAVRIDLANLYFDARRFDLAVPWYEAALKLEPKK
jgi:cytochrome c-type biogenesis protein CcmH/NrfG